VVCAHHLLIRFLLVYFPRPFSLRQQFTAGRLWSLIFICTMPLVVVEVCGLILFPPDRVLVLNEEETIGRCTFHQNCSSVWFDDSRVNSQCATIISHVTYADECGHGSSQKFQFATTSIIFFTMFADLCQVQR